MDSSHSGSVTQYAGSVESGRDLSLTAGRDLAVIASQIDAKRDVSMTAAQNLVLASAANESHFYSKSSHVTEQTDHVAQVATSVNAGGDIRLSAGQDMALVSSKVNAGNDAFLVAGGKLNVLAAQNTDYSLYDKQSSGGLFGGGSSRHDEVTQVTNIGSQITAGGDIGLISGSDQRYQVAKLDSNKDLTLQSGGTITFEGVKDLHKEDHSKSDNGFAWTSMSGSGSTDETLRQTEMSAKGQLVIKAVDGLHIDVKQINEQTVSQAIDAMVQADPQLAWLKDAEKRGDVDWRQIKELHDSYSYSHSGLGAGAMLVIMIIVSVLTAGAASSAIGSMAEAGVGSGSAMAAGGSAAMVSAGTAVGEASAGWANVALTASAMSMASTGVVSVINNQGNLGAALSDTFSANSLKSAAISGLAAGAMSYVDSTWLKPAQGATNGGSQVTTLGAVQNPGYTSDMLTWSNAADTVLRSGTHAVISSGISTAINGGSFGSNLGSALVNEGIDLAAGAGNRGVGDLAHYLGVDPGTANAMLLHATLGGLISVAKGQDFTSGAIAGGVAEGLTPIANGLLAQYASDKFAAGDLSEQGSQDKIATAQIIGLLSASLAGGDAATGSMIGGYGEKYNGLLHLQKMMEAAAELQKTLPKTTGGNLEGDIARQDPTNQSDSMGMPISGSSPTNPPNQSALMVAALMGGFAGRFGAPLAISLEGALASLPSIGRLFSIGDDTAAGVRAVTSKGSIGVAPEGVSVVDVSGEKSVEAAGRVEIEAGAVPDANEIRAGEGLSDLGYDVTHQATASSQGIVGERTADLFVEGVGDVDVYTPKNINPSNIVRGIEKKADQAVGVLVQADLEGADMSSIAARMWGKTNAQNIKTILFQKADGSIIRFNRP